MLAGIPSRWVLALVGLGSLGVSAASQRRVVVQSGEDLYLRWAAHRLGVSVEKVEQARKALQMATDLAPSVAGSEAVGTLGDMWLALNWSQAQTQIQSLVKELCRLARTTEDPGVYARATADAQTLKANLLMIDEEGSHRILENWPDPPEGGVAPQPGISREQRMNNRLRLQQLSSTDLDRALDMLAEMEAGQPDASLRMLLLFQLENRGRTEQADQLLAGLIEAMPTVQDPQQAQSYLGLFSWMARYRPELLDGFIPAWAELARAFPMPSASMPSPEGLFLAPDELGIARQLMNLHQMSPEAAQRALQHFPELARKLDDMGGLNEFVKSYRQQRDKTLTESREATRQRGERSVEDIVSEISRLMVEVQRYTRGVFQPEKASSSLGEALRLLKELDGEPEQVSSYLRVGLTHLLVQGELSREMIELGREIVEAAEDDGVQNFPASGGGQAAVSSPRELEVWLHAAECWTDFEESIKEVKSLEDELQYAVLSKFAAWVVGTQGMAFPVRSFQ